MKLAATLLAVALWALSVMAAPALAQDDAALAAARENAQRGEALRAEGRWAEAADALESAARVMVAQQGAQVPETLAVLILYADSLEEAERFADARMMARQIMDQAAAAERFTAFLMAAEIKARVDWVLGDPAAALEIYQLLIPFAEGREPGQAGAGRAPAYRLGEATMLVELFRFDEASPRLEALIHGPNPRLAAAAEAVRAKMLSEQGDIDAALAAYAALTDEARTEVTSEASMRESLTSFASTLLEAGQLEAADQIAARLVEMFDAAGESESWGAATALRVRAAAAHRLEQLDAALAFQSQAIERLTERLGPAHPQTLNASAALALMLAESGDAEAAAATARQTLITASEALPADSATLARIRVTVGVAAREAGDARPAVMLLASGQAGLAGVLGEAHPETVSSRVSLADILLSPDRYAPSDALGLLRQVSAVRGQGLSNGRRAVMEFDGVSPGYLHVEAAWAVAHD